MNQQDKHNYLLRFHKFQKNRERHFAPKINKALIAQYKQFTANIHLGLEMALLKIDSTGMRDVMRQLYIDAGTNYGDVIRRDLKRFKGRMPIGFSEDMRQLIIDYFSIDILNQSEGITDTTRELIRTVFTRSYELGLGIDDIVKQLENTELSRVRARMIARTETVTSANKGAMFVAKKTGLKLNKEWLATFDNRTRHDHRIVNGQTIPYDEFFKLPEGVTMQQPGAREQENGLPVPAKDVVNCRCSVLFTPIEVNGKLVRA